ncbi:MAG: hypothetical protein AVDCRST_MAG41-3659 [uncultured Corynebacteriales bacterium]|uniref:Mersacidin/lichenicidin family type 2 lantibiotic n=1 Tax=uncultured Mycobacteriales bacterium TaxID=581187 RepID=A0A6J4JLB4_9ACTN|nr:MAG: hypothetical protein AVDCRST_MAG41-3659 [uncultured Corynebacteriales bacterium]
MTTSTVARAWRDPDYFGSLSAEEQALIPANPAGQIAPMLEDEVNGAFPTGPCTVPCPTALPCAPFYYSALFLTIPLCPYC